jgi:hypothetical protein
MAFDLETAAGEACATCHNHLGGNLIIATVAHDLDTVRLYWLLVVNSGLSY